MKRRINAMDDTYKAVEAAETALRPIDCPEIYMENLNQCAECRKGEHEDYDTDVLRVYIRDPETKKFVKRAYLCGEHRQAFEDDGYEVIAC